MFKPKAVYYGIHLFIFLIYTDMRNQLLISSNIGLLSRYGEQLKELPKITNTFICGFDVNILFF